MWFLTPSSLKGAGKAPLMCIKRQRVGLIGVVVVGDHIQGRAVEVVELARVHGEPEGRADRDREHEAQRNEEEEDVHGVPRSRRAFATTASELADIPMPAMKGVTMPAKASGITSKL